MVRKIPKLILSSVVICGFWGCQSQPSMPDMNGTTMSMMAIQEAQAKLVKQEEKECLQKEEEKYTQVIDSLRREKNLLETQLVNANNEIHKLEQLQQWLDGKITRLHKQVNNEKKKQAKYAKKCVKGVCRAPSKMVCHSSNRLVVVSLSTFSGRQPKAIRDSFIEVFSSMKRRKSGKRFTLHTIQSGGQPSSALLTCNDLRNVSNSSIQAKVNQVMQFGATDLQSIANLSKLNSQARSKGRVLYITDNKRINASLKKRDILLAWTKAGVRLMVLTTGECIVWNNVGATCKRWTGKSSLKNSLKSFLQ